MSKELALTLAIIIIVALLIVFVVSFVLYKRTPVPKGCENLEISEENCAACNNKECTLRKKEEK
jgi:hypothetical protein